MVSFVCNHCQQTLKKPKLEPHTYSCRNANFTCIDCNTDFYGTDYRGHTSCISEAQKYQKGLYKGNKNSQKPQVPKKETPINKNQTISQPIQSEKRPTEVEVASVSKKQKVDTDKIPEAEIKKASESETDLKTIANKAMKDILIEKPKIKFSKLKSKLGKAIKKSAGALNKDEALKAAETQIIEALKNDDFSLSL